MNRLIFYTKPLFFGDEIAVFAKRKKQLKCNLNRNDRVNERQGDNSTTTCHCEWNEMKRSKHFA